MTETRPILTTKIEIPPLAPNFLPRRRLFEALDAALQPIKRLTLISAPAGYGKTSLVSAWVQHQGHPAAWVSLDEQDNDPVRFGLYVIHAIRRARPDLEAPDLPSGPFAAGEYQEKILIPILNQLGCSPETMLIVLDDFHWIKDPSVEQMVEFVLENLPASVHIMLLTRADPALPIARLRGRGQLNELRMQELRFQPEEVEAFLAVFDELRLSKDDIHTLARRTEGWIAGIQMAVASLQGHADQSGFIKDFSGGHQYIMDYLLEEVLRRQTPQLQTFLLNTSILSRLSGPLCDAVMQEAEGEFPPSEQVLRQLARANLFVVPLDTGQTWFRYHRLFADLLEARLTVQAPERITDLHRRAGAWCEQNGLVEEALRHALQSENYPLAADLLECVAEDWLMRSETSTFLRWIQRLPPQAIADRPRLAIFQAWALLFQGSPLRVVEALIPAEESDHELPGGAELLRAFLILCQGDIQEGLHLSQEALRLLPEEEVFLRDFAVFCAAGAHLANGDGEAAQRLYEESTQSSLQSGNRSASVIFLTELAEMRLKEMHLEEARRLYQQALEAATDSQGALLPIGGRALLGLGSLAIEHNRLDEAEQMLTEGLELTSRWNLFNTFDGQLTLATLYQLQGDYARLDDKLDELFDLARRFDLTDIDDVVVALVAAGLKSRQGDFGAVRRWIEERGLQNAPEELPESYSENFMLGRLYKYELPIVIRLLIAEERFAPAQQAVGELLLLAEEAHRPFLTLETKILQALLLYAMGNREESLAALRNALEYAQPAGAARLFISEGALVKQLLQDLRPALEVPHLVKFVDQILQTPTAEAVADFGPLSPRELDVLRLLPSDLTAEEIAVELVVSVNTVRTHMKNIYAKLDVHSRHQAVDKARLQGLL